MPIILDGTAGIDNNATDLSYTGTLTGGTGVVNLGSGQLFKDASGNVGIGTSSPFVKLQATGTIKVATGNAQGILSLGDGNGATVNCGVWRGAANAPTTDGNFLNFGGFDGLVFATGNAAIGSQTERARIDSSGNLLVACTSAPSSTNRGALIGPNGPSGVQIVLANTITSSFEGVISFINGNGTVGKINTGGSSTSYNTSSDYRLKHDITPMTGALARVAALKPCTYKWNVDNSEDEGFIAHELAEVCPSAVAGEKDAVNEDGSIKPQGIDTSFLVATLTAAIQEQQAIIESLTARVVALENQIV